jgi:hypothetical protein
MPKQFSVVSWNVEHFKGDAGRVKRIANFIKGQNGGPQNVPDVIALYEVEGKDIYKVFMEQFPEHRFHLTEGKQTQEIFLGVHRDLQSFTTQRLEFKTKREYQRPGLLLTIRIGNTNYPILFLHIRSGSNTEDFGLRDAAIISAFKLKKNLDEVSNKDVNEDAKFTIAGDLNTMGIDDPVPYSTELDFSSEQEIARIAKWAGNRKMKLLPKDRTTIAGQPKEVTWYNGSDDYEPTDLDHVIVSDKMDIRDQNGTKNNITVLGWPKMPESQWDSWLTEYSDHGMLYFEVW